VFEFAAEVESAEPDFPPQLVSIEADATNTASNARLRNDNRFCMVIAVKKMK
jgi:hypothetical protein